jgi:hypothetical protein
MTPEIAFVSYAREVSEEPKNVDTFMARWGEDYGFTRIEAENLFADSEANSPEDPFHNYDHHLESLWIVMALVDLDRKNGNDTDGKTIAVAEMLHDVGVRKGKDVIPEFQGAAFVIQNYERYGLSFEQGIIAADLIIATAENAVIGYF